MKCGRVDGGGFLTTSRAVLSLSYILTPIYYHGAGRSMLSESKPPFLCLFDSRRPRDVIHIPLPPSTYFYVQLHNSTLGMVWSTNSQLGPISDLIRASG